MRVAFAALLAVAMLVAGCGGGGRTVTVTTQSTQAGTSGWSARARANFVNYCESTAGGGEKEAGACECEAGKLEAQVPSDAQLRELENNPADKERLVKLMIDASYACVGSG